MVSECYIASVETTCAKLVPIGWTPEFTLCVRVLVGTRIST